MWKRYNWDSISQATQQMLRENDLLLKRVKKIK
jgi:hypothetical protein